LAIELNGSKLFRYISLHDFDDYMPEDTDKKRVYELLEKAIKLLPQEQSNHVKNGYIKQNVNLKRLFAF
jgi:Mor family transcriptional regulator